MIPSPHLKRHAIAAACSLLPTPAFAQEEAEPPARREIVVTARKQAEPLSRAPIPLSVLDGRGVFNGGITHVDRLAERFVALTVQPNSTGNLLFVRGVGNFTLLANSEPAVGWNYDGVFVARPMGTNGQFFDLERVELLKGPQGVLYGRNASAGTVNVIPQRPVPGETAGYVSANLGNYNALGGEAAINLPMGADGALRVSGQIVDQDNFLSGYNDGPDQQSLRVQMLARPLPGLSVRLSGDYIHLGGVGLGTTYLGNYTFDAAGGRYRFTPSGLPRSKGVYSPEAQAFRQSIFLPTLGRRLDALGTPPWQDHDFYGAHAEVKADLGSAELTLLPAWRYANLNAVIPGPPFSYRQRETQEQKSLEARLAGKAGPVDWVLGAYLFDEDLAVDYAQSFSTQASFQDQLFTTRSRALFGNLIWRATPGLRLGAGARITWDRKHLDSLATNLTILCQQRVNGLASCPTVPLFPLAKRLSEVAFPIPAAGAPPVPLRADGGLGGALTGAVISRTDTRIDTPLRGSAATWRVSADTDLGPAGVAYASIETGYRPGGINGATGFETYRPERITAYTLGARWREARQRLSFAVELFWWDYRDQHVSSVQPDLGTPPRNGNYTRNIGRSRIRGVEADMTLRPTRLSQIFVNVQYLDAEYRSFRFIQANTGTPPLTGCAATLNAATNLYTIDCSGQRPFSSPRWTISLAARQDIEIGRLKLGLMARTRYTGRQMAGAAFLAEQVLPGHWMSDAQIMLTGPGERFELAGFVRNIEGNRTPSFVIFHPVSNAVVASTTQPRTYGLRATARF